MGKYKTKKEVLNVSGRQNELITVTDEKGNVLKRFINPISTKFYPRDVMQVVVGATILAIPVAFTEEVWILGRTLPIYNILGLLVLSLTFISMFVYYNYYRGRMKEHKKEFVKRIITTYLVSFFVVALILTLIQGVSWEINIVEAFSISVIVALPASMSAAVADIVK